MAVGTDILNAVESSAGSIVSSSVQSVTIESAAFFPLELDQPLGGLVSSGDGGPAVAVAPAPLWQRILRPKITVQTLAGPLVISPGGDPPAFPYLLLIGATIIGLAAYGAATLFAPARGAARRALPAVGTAPSKIGSYKRRRRLAR